MVEVKQVRQIPVWLSVLVTLAAIGGGVWVVRWYFTTSPSGGEVINRGPDDGVRAVFAGHNWNVVSGNAGLKVSKNRKGEFQAGFYFPHYDFIPPAQFDALTNARRVTADGAVAEQLEVTDAQMTVLRAQVRRAFEIPLPAADQEKLLGLFQDYLKAPETSRRDPETALLQKLEEVGNRVIPAAKQTVTEASVQARAALSPEQWQKFEKMGL